MTEAKTRTAAIAALAQQDRRASPAQMLVNRIYYDRDRRACWPRRAASTPWTTTAAAISSCPDRCRNDRLTAIPLRRPRPRGRRPAQPRRAALARRAPHRLAHRRRLSDLSAALRIAAARARTTSPSWSPASPPCWSRCRRSPPPGSSLRHPDLHGITDQLIALALIAAWAAGDLITAALLPLVMTIGHILEERSLLGSQEAIRALSRLTQTKARRLLPSGEVEEVDCAGPARRRSASSCAPATSFRPTASSRAAHSSIDTASITGESVPVEVQAGQRSLHRLDQSRRPPGGEAHARRARTTLGRVDRADAGGRECQAAGHAPARALCRALYGARAAARGRHLVHDQQHGRDAGGAGRLLPLRAGAGRARHIDRRHRGGEPPRHPGQGRGLPGEPRDRRRGGVRQDRHRHHRPSALVEARPEPGVDHGRADRARRHISARPAAIRSAARSPACCRSTNGCRSTRSRKRTAWAWSAALGAARSCALGRAELFQRAGHRHLAAAEP